MPKSTQPINSYFFPNPFGDNVAYTIEAASLEEAQAILQATNQASPQPASQAPAVEPEPSPEPAPSMEPSTAAAEPAEAETKENN